MKAAPPSSPLRARSGGGGTKLGPPPGPPPPSPPSPPPAPAPAPPPSPLPVPPPPSPERQGRFLLPGVRLLLLGSRPQDKSSDAPSSLIASLSLPLDSDDEGDLHEAEGDLPCRRDRERLFGCLRWHVFSNMEYRCSMVRPGPPPVPWGLNM